MNIERMGYSQGETKLKESLGKRLTLPLAVAAVIIHNIAANEYRGLSKIGSKVQELFHQLEDRLDWMMSDVEHSQYWDALRHPSVHNPDKTIGYFILKETTAECNFSVPNFDLKKGQRYIRTHSINESDRKITAGLTKETMREVAEYIKINKKKLPKKGVLVAITYNEDLARFLGKLGFTITNTPYVEGKKRLFAKTLRPADPENPSEHSGVFVCFQSYDQIVEQFAEKPCD